MHIDYPVRLQSYLAKSGFGSRRSCEKLIAEGRVSINTKVVREMGVKVNAEDVVMVDDILAEPADRIVYYALHKPKGYVCTNYDPNEKLYARDLITVPEHNLLFHVGRLDKESTGLILYTNDGDAAQQIMHPSSEIEKEYAVMTAEPIQRADLEEALRGVYIDSQKPYVIKKFEIRSKRWAVITLTEGKNRELRKIFSYFGYTIKRLVRIRIGPIKLDDLAIGAYRPVRKQEIIELLEGKNG
jgi:23S rRNA pseudouridine2605 synthase